MAGGAIYLTDSENRLKTAEPTRSGDASSHGDTRPHAEHPNDGATSFFNACWTRQSFRQIREENRRDRLPGLTAPPIMPILIAIDSGMPSSKAPTAIADSLPQFPPPQRALLVADRLRLFRLTTVPAGAPLCRRGASATKPIAVEPKAARLIRLVH